MTSDLTIFSHTLHEHNFSFFQNSVGFHMDGCVAYVSYGIYETSCGFYIPEPPARGYKTHNEFHKYRMK